MQKTLIRKSWLDIRCPDKTSGDITYWDKTAGGTTRPTEPNIGRDKTSGRLNIRGDKTSGDITYVGQKVREDKTGTDILPLIVDKLAADSW
jgi:hypothetical protein